MAALDQITLTNGGTVYDLNDRRITTTAITTCSHILASQSAGLSSIAPITAANLASVLGGQIIQVTSTQDLNDCTKMGVYYYWTAQPANSPIQNATMFNTFFRQQGSNAQVCLFTSPTNPRTFIRYQDGPANWGTWKEFSYDVPNFYKDYNSLSSFGVALGASLVSSNEQGRICPICRINNSAELDSFEGIGYYDDSASHNQIPTYSGLVISVHCGKILGDDTVSDGYMQVLFSFARYQDTLSFEKKYRSKRNGTWSNWTDF